MSQRINIKFHDDQLQSVGEIAKEMTERDGKKITFTELTRRALKLFEIGYINSKQGYKIGVYDPKTGALIQEIDGF